MKYEFVTVTERTENPLSKIICYEVNCDKEFVLDLEIPSECESYKTELNGEMVVNLSRDGIIKFDRVWKCGDVLELTLNMKSENK